LEGYPKGKGMRRMALWLLVLPVMASGCQLAQPAFARTAANAGSAFAAASTTLSYAHEGKITYAYASSSFVNYQSELSRLDQALPAQQGALLTGRAYNACWMSISLPCRP